jgi:hypothetical protein
MTANATLRHAFPELDIFGLTGCALVIITACEVKAGQLALCF